MQERNKNNNDTSIVFTLTKHDDIILMTFPLIYRISV